MGSQSRSVACDHGEVDLLNPWELLRKYVCKACGAVMTCACTEDIATLVLPHQADRGVDPVTAQEVPVTHALTPGVCYECRGINPPPYPHAPHRGASSVIHRYYWHELFTLSQRAFLRWADDNGLLLVDQNGQSRVFELRREHSDQAAALDAAALEEIRAWHESNPRYDTRRPSDSDILKAAEVTTVELAASYLTPNPGAKVLVVPVGASDPATAVSVEEFASHHYRLQGRQVLAVESRPFQCLYGCFMWMWVCDPSDERNRIAYFGARDGVGADENGLIGLAMPEDFGTANHAARRSEALREHLNSLPHETSEMLWLYDYWLEPSRPFRQYLWAYTPADESRARTTLEVLGARRIKEILAFLAGDYWERYLGWPDLLTWRPGQTASANDIAGSDEGNDADQCREDDHRESDAVLVEVKSSNDKLSEDQRTWITLNHNLLRLPFELVKVHRKERLYIDQTGAI